MFGLLAVLVYLVAVGIPLFALYRFHAQAWWCHALAILGALALGFVPTPPAWKAQFFDLVFGFVFVLLLVWGMGGLVALLRPHHGGREKHA